MSDIKYIIRIVVRAHCTLDEDEERVIRGEDTSHRQYEHHHQAPFKDRGLLFLGRKDRGRERERERETYIYIYTG